MSSHIPAAVPLAPPGPQYDPPVPPMLVVAFEIVFEIKMLSVDEDSWMPEDVPPVPPEPDHPSDPPIPPVTFDIVFEFIVLFVDDDRYMPDDAPPVPPEP